MTLTAAIAGVRQLLHHGPGESVATISNLSVVGPETLAEYHHRHRARLAPVESGNGAVGTLASSDLGVVVQQTATPTSSSTETPMPTSSPTETATPTATSSATATATPSGVIKHQLKFICDPVGTAVDPDHCDVPTVVGVCLPDAPADSLLRCIGDAVATTSQELASPLRGTPKFLTERIDMGHTCGVNALARGCPLHDFGHQTSNTAAGRRAAYKRLIAGIRSTRVRPGRGGPAELLGVVVSFDATFEGLQGHDVTVTWTVYNADAHRHLSSDWFVDRLDARWHVQSGKDKGSDDIWVPLPPHRGRYFARISVNEANGDRITYMDTQPFH